MKKQLITELCLAPAIAALLGALCTGGAYAQQYDANYLTLDPSSAMIVELARAARSTRVPPGP